MCKAEVYKAEILEALPGFELRHKQKKGPIKMVENINSSSTRTRESTSNLAMSSAKSAISLLCRGRASAGRMRKRQRYSAAHFGLLPTIPENSQISFTWEAAQAWTTVSSLVACTRKSKRSRRKSTSKRELAVQLSKARTYISKLRSDSDDEDEHWGLYEVVFSAVFILVILLAFLLSSTP
mmetsp:Transcript_19468/g.38134  ORF Transcript_19468/g.38134 Transcript_19468/m.38134 type:complete len:181 (+) Transcript_19468:395-937(+)